MRAVFRCLPMVISSGLRHSVSFRGLNYPVLGFGVETLPKNECSVVGVGQNVAQSLIR
jgi:hypothetical protein